MGIFLHYFSDQLAPDVHAVLILDQAGWHDERALRVPRNVTLPPLPTASPELNPVERIWLYLRERYLSHRVLAVRMRDVLGASDHLKRLGQAAGIEWRIVTGVSVGGEHSQALGHDPLRGSALEHALATSVVGLIE